MFARFFHLFNFMNKHNLIKKMLKLYNLTIGYNKHPVIHHINMHIEKGTSVAVIGPNGCGKSSLLKGIMSFIKPMEGRIECSIPQNNIAYLPQSSTVDKTFPMTTFELVASGLFYKKSFLSSVGKEDKIQVNKALEKVGLLGMADEPLKSLSGGQLQKSLFARLMIQDSELILLDEPFNAVDYKTTAELLKIIKMWISEGKTIVAVLHDLSQVRDYFAYTAILSRELIAYGKTKNVLNNENIEKAFNNTFYPHKNAVICNK